MFVCTLHFTFHPSGFNITVTDGETHQFSLGAACIKAVGVLMYHHEAIVTTLDQGLCE